MVTHFFSLLVRDWLVVVSIGFALQGLVGLGGGAVI